MQDLIEMVDNAQKNFMYICIPKAKNDNAEQHLRNICMWKPSPCSPVPNPSFPFPRCPTPPPSHRIPPPSSCPIPKTPKTKERGQTRSNVSVISSIRKKLSREAGYVLFFRNFPENHQRKRKWKRAKGGEISRTLPDKGEDHTSTPGATSSCTRKCRSKVENEGGRKGWESFHER